MLSSQKLAVSDSFRVGSRRWRIGHLALDSEEICATIDVVNY
jgi:hypothetical protein